MLFINYLLTLIPGLMLGAVLFYALRKSHPLFHLLIFIFLFIFTRDAMTPSGLWRIGKEGFLWIRFISDPLILVILGLSSLGFVFLMQTISPVLASKNKWFIGNKSLGLIIGIVGAIIVALPLLLVYHFSAPIEVRGGIVPIFLIPFILFITLSGNLYEEVLFRGYFFGWLTENENIKPVAAGILSGVFFSFGHIFLAFNVTNVGIGILVFTLWEGCLAGLVRARFGVIPAVLTHGLAIFFLTSGLI